MNNMHMDQGKDGKSIFERISKTAEQNGDRIAFSSRAGNLTYAELWEKSGRLAGYIAGRIPDDAAPVMVYGHKEPYMLVSFLACARAHHPYCPVDVNTPAERIRDIYEAIGTDFRIDRDSYRTAMEAVCRAPDIALQNKGEDIQYIIFTSGSTGKPKGVRITVANLENYLRWARTLSQTGQDLAEIKHGSVFLNQAPFSFDLSVMDLYISLTTGGTLVSVDKDLQKDIPEMLRYMSVSGIEYWVSTPSFADMCLADPGFGSGNLPELKVFLFCGETLGKKTAQELIERFPEAKIMNTYGPTESTVCVTSVEITEEMTKREGALPVGVPKNGTTIKIDPDTQEMIIVGDTVSPGYFNDPEKTAASFCMEDVEGRSVRAYHTGDKGHYGDDGMLYCDGRLDRQIKLHGYRMELGDIEENLAAIDGITAAAVIPISRNGKIDSLTAFVTKTDEIADDYSGRKFVRTAASERLPAYMIPKRIRFIGQMPLTANGKIDRKALEVM